MISLRCASKREAKTRLGVAESTSNASQNATSPFRRDIIFY